MIRKPVPSYLLRIRFIKNHSTLLYHKTLCNDFFFNRLRNETNQLILLDHHADRAEELLFLS